MNQQYLCSQAARMERLDILDWLVAEGCTTGPDIAPIASACGNTEILQWVIENSHDFEWNGRCVPEAAENGHLHTLEFLLKNGCPLPGTRSEICAYSAMEGAAKGNYWNIVGWLREQGCEWPEDCSLAEDACRQHNIDALQWLVVEQGYPWDVESCFKVAKKQKFADGVQWINTHYLAPLRAQQNKKPRARKSKKTSAETASGPSGFTCSNHNCNETFDSKVGLHRHMKWRHPVLCPVCNASFALRHHMNEHKAVSHAS